MKILRIAEVEKKTGLSRTTIWRREKAGAFPARKELGTNTVGWLESEVDKWIEELPTSKGVA